MPEYLSANFKPVVAHVIKLSNKIIALRFACERLVGKHKLHKQIV